MSGHRVFIIAGEASGDAHARGLMGAMRQLEPEIEFAGLGGQEMENFDPAVRDWTEEAAVVGLVEVLKNYPYFKAEFERALDDAERFRPDAVVLVDYPGFNLRFADAIRKRGIDTKIVYNIIPQEWAWKRGRIARMSKVLDLMLCLFPFEVGLYERSGLEAVFVGHPMGERLGELRASSQRRDSLVALLPGSRRREVEKIFPVLLAAAVEMAKLRPGLEFASAAAGERLAAEMQVMAEAHGVACEIGVGDSARLMATATCGAVASGTASLEAAFLGLPYCLIYKVARPTYRVARLVMAVEHLGMANLLAGREVVREFLQDDATPEALAAQLLCFVDHPKEREELADTLREVTAPLAEGGAYARAAESALGCLSAAG